MRVELRAPDHGLSAPRPGLPGGASAAGTRSSAAGPGRELEERRERRPTPCPEPPRDLRPQGTRQRWGAGGRHRAPRRKPSGPRLVPHGTRTAPASCTRATAGLGASSSRWPLAPPGPPPPLLRELGALRWTRGERGSGTAVPAAPPSPRVVTSGARVRPGADGGWAPGVRCCSPTSCRVNPSPPKTQFPH